jgi:oxygen-independent coproporphyrinogen-3 oxidase
MAGIYIHIPFCKRICSYCDFYKSGLTHLIPSFLDSLHIEIHQRSGYLEKEPIETIYFGGGTPSLLNIQQISRIIEDLNKNFQIEQNCEITIEANPDDLSVEYLMQLHGIGINRLSIGIQSFNDNELKLLNRRHDSLQSIRSIEFARTAGFKNLSVDLIYGIPGMTNKTWQENLEMGVQSEHISVYHLTIEPGTALSRSVSKGLLSLVDEKESEDQFFLAREICISRGFDHYEISNMAKPGYISKHNSNYWLQKRYLGLGPSAHSFNIISRQWNHADIKKYISGAESGQFGHELELLSEKNRYNEHLMLALRTAWGADEHKIEDVFGKEFRHRFITTVQPFIQSGHIENDVTVYKMTPKGWLISDYILSCMMMAE